MHSAERRIREPAAIRVFIAPLHDEAVIDAGKEIAARRIASHILAFGACVGGGGIGRRLADDLAIA
jgi:hypothetical protein